MNCVRIDWFTPLRRGFLPLEAPALLERGWTKSPASAISNEKNGSKVGSQHSSLRLRKELDGWFALALKFK
jgi:hypothetical protein